jgi:hypothetical protein
MQRLAERSARAAPVLTQRTASRSEVLGTYQADRIVRLFHGDYRP